MSNIKTLFMDEDPKRRLRDIEVTVKRVFDFKDAGYAATVEALPDNDLHLYGDIRTVKPAELEFELLTATNDVAQRVADYGDIKELHKFNDEQPVADGITIAAMDSGFDPEHPVFEGRRTRFYDVTGNGKGDEVGHGTACLGLIAQHAPGAELEMVRIFGQEGRTGMEEILSAYEYLFANADRIDVVNMSWGTNSKVPEIDRLQNKLVELGVRPVTAAGNTGRKGGSPATAEKAFSAGACNVEGKMASFSSYNPNYDNPDVTAIGVNNWLAQASGTSMGESLSGPWTKASGTSFAAPIVSAAVGRYLQNGRQENVVSDFEENSVEVPDTPREGAGLLNYEAAISELEPKYTDTANANVWSLWKTQKDMTYINADWLSNGKYKAYLKASDEGGVTIRFEKRD